jgi:molybdopterin molybdotransferase
MERVTPEQARALILAETDVVSGSVTVPLLSARGGVTVSALYAPLDNPPFARSPLDGFAFRSADTSAASAQTRARLKVVKTLHAGDWYDGVIAPGEAVKIMTGAPIPEGADAVLGKENVRSENGAEGNYAVITRTVGAYENYVFQGEDIQKGELLFPAGTYVTSGHLGVLASMGFETVDIRRPLKIGLLCTGDEIVPPGQPLPKGKIYNSNETLLASRLEECGFSAERLPQTGDDAERVARILAERIGDFDFLITTGAVSVGDKDIFHEVFAKLGVRRVFYRLASRPGNAALCGVYQNKLLFCLSGNPFAALLSFELLVRPAIARMTGRVGLDIQRRKAILDTPFSKQAGMRRFVRAKLDDGHITLPGGNTSGQLFSFAGCDCFLDAPTDTETLNPGDEVDILLL